MTKPITPNDIPAVRAKMLPPEVLETFNELITEHYSNGRSTVKQKEVVERLETAGFNHREIYDKGYLNVEEIYRDAGWHVKFDKPGYNESYDAYFVFSH